MEATEAVQGIITLLGEPAPPSGSALAAGQRDRRGRPVLRRLGRPSDQVVRRGDDLARRREVERS